MEYGEFLTVAEIAQLLRLNQQTVRNWIDRGELPAVRVGSRRVRVRRAELDEFLAAGATQAPEVPSSAERDSRDELAAAMIRAGELLGDGDRPELVDALRAVAAQAQRLADAVSQQAGHAPA